MLLSPRSCPECIIKVMFDDLRTGLGYASGSHLPNLVITPKAVTHRIAAFRDLSKQKQDPAGGEGEETLSKTPIKPRTPRTPKKRGRAMKEGNDESDRESPQKKSSSEFLF